jgi:hypothetical protein
VSYVPKSRPQLLEVPGNARRQFRRFLVQPLQVNADRAQSLLEVEILILLLGRDADEAAGDQPFARAAASAPKVSISAVSVACAPVSSSQGSANGSSLRLIIGIAVSYETVRRWVNHFGPKIATDLRKRRPKPRTIWHLDEVYLKIDGRFVYLWRAVDAEGEVLDVLVQTRRNKRGRRSN